MCDTENLSNYNRRKCAANIMQNRCKLVVKYVQKCPKMFGFLTSDKNSHIQKRRNKQMQKTGPYSLTIHMMKTPNRYR